MRLLPDGRIIFGGEDTSFNSNPIKEKKARKKYDKLLKSLCELFPSFKNKIKIEYEFCGCFGTTNNNMGLIGKSEMDDDLLLFISCGANGIINAMVGVELLDDIIQNKHNKMEKLFSPTRKNI